MKERMQGRLRQHQPVTRACLALLLVIQAVGGGAVTLAHAADPNTAVVHIETKHDAACVVMHDALRCALCHYAGVTAVVAPPRFVTAVAAVIITVPSTAAIPTARPRLFFGSPRAPPTTLS